MRGFWLLVHVLGFTLWLGGGIATMVAGITAKRLGTGERLTAYKIIGAVQRLLVAPAAATNGSGIMISRASTQTTPFVETRVNSRLRVCP